MGYVVRFGRWTVYHSGDTVLYDGMVERLGAERIDVALLPINGRAPERRVAGNLNGPEAAALAHSARGATGHPLPLRDVRVQYCVACSIRCGSDTPGPTLSAAALRRALVQPRVEPCVAAVPQAFSVR